MQTSCLTEFFDMMLSASEQSARGSSHRVVCSTCTRELFVPFFNFECVFTSLLPACTIPASSGAIWAAPHPCSGCGPSFLQTTHRVAGFNFTTISRHWGGTTKTMSPSMVVTKSLVTSRTQKAFWIPFMEIESILAWRFWMELICSRNSIYAFTRWGWCHTQWGVHTGARCKLFWTWSPKGGTDETRDVVLPYSEVVALPTSARRRRPQKQVGGEVESVCIRRALLAESSKLSEAAKCIGQEEARLRKCRLASRLFTDRLTDPLLAVTKIKVYRPWWWCAECILYDWAGCASWCASCFVRSQYSTIRSLIGGWWTHCAATARRRLVGQKLSVTKTVNGIQIEHAMSVVVKKIFVQRNSGIAGTVTSMKARADSVRSATTDSTL